MKDAKGHGSDAHSDGVQQVGTPSSFLVEQHRLALADRAARSAATGDRWDVSRAILPSGHELYTSVKPRQGNSRGARRGGHDVFSYDVRAPGEQYSKRIAFGKIKDHFV